MFYKEGKGDTLSENVNFFRLCTEVDSKLSWKELEEDKELGQSSGYVSVYKSL